MSLIATPLGYILYFCYIIVKNYGIALILFTLVTKLILFPLSVKQQKNSAKMAKFQPKMEQLKKKYGNNQEKLNEEMMKLYSEENYNPMGSCLPLIITMVVLFGLIDVVYKPLTHVIKPEKEVLNSVTEFVEMEENRNLFEDNFEIGSADYENKRELFLIQIIKTKSELFEASAQDTYIANFFENADAAYSEVINKFVEENEALSAMDKPTLYSTFANFSEYKDAFKTFTLEYHPQSEACKLKNADAELFYEGLYKFIDEDYSTYRLAVKTFFQNDNSEFINDVVEFENALLGFDMGVVPTWKSKYVIIPILSLITNLISIIYTQRKQRQLNPAMQSMGMGMNLFMYTTPILSMFIAFNVPSGVGFYWILSSVFSLIQSFILYNVYTPEYVEKLIKKDNAKRKAKGKQSFYEKALEAQQMQKNGTAANSSAKAVSEPESEDEKKSRTQQKEDERRRLNEARKRMAEKYGDEYTED